MPPPEAGASVRLLSTAQMAFVRAWAEGIDLATAWHRFLHVEGSGDGRRARQELQRLLEELKRLARLHGRADIAALLCRDPEAIVEHRSSAPTLDVFAASLESDFYSEAELLALYTDRFGRQDVRNSARRRQRLRERLVQAIQWLSEHVTRPASPQDALDLWLDARVAARLKRVGIERVGDLMLWVHHKGYHWHRQIPRLGPKGSARLLAWLRSNEDSLGALPPSARLPRSQWDHSLRSLPPCTGIVPLERLLMPHDERSGANGTNRAPASRCKLKAASDLEAIQAWLQLRQPDSHTWRAYRKEAERFLLWAIMERRKALSSLDTEDCVAYRRFLAQPSPDWLVGRQVWRSSESWRPFEGPLSDRSRALALSIVRSLCDWLVRQRYLDSNPWDGVPVLDSAAAPAPLRALTPAQWALVQQWLEAQPDSAAQARLRFLMQFVMLTGLRLAELSAARLGWFAQARAGRAEPRWLIRVRNHLGRSRDVPLPDTAMAVLRSYLRHRQLSEDPRLNEASLPLLARLHDREGLSASRIYTLLTRGFDRCAVALESGDPVAAQRIRAASTQWLRNSYGSHAAASGVRLDVLQNTLGHRSAAATSRYLRSEMARGC
jgi:site-specific recombinase XerD